MQGGKEGGQFKKLKWMLRPKMSGYPSKRWGHTTVVHDGRLLLYGGNYTGVVSEGVYKIDCESLEANNISFSQAPQARESHSCCLIGDSLYVFGGCINQELTNELLQLRIAQPYLSWRKLQQKNPLPPRESQVSLALTNTHMLIYGGTTPSETMLDDFWICNLETITWQQITDVKGAIQPKIGLSMTMIGQNIFAFGGELGEGEGSILSNDVYRLHFENQNFSSTPPPQLIITKLQVQGVRPSQRTGHCCVDYKGRMLIMMGGEGISDKRAPLLYNDTWTFNLKNLTWTELFVDNRNSFRPRSNFTANIHKNTIYIFGGFINLTNFKCTDELVTLTLHQNKHTTSHREPQVSKITNDGPLLCPTCKLQSLTQARSLDINRIQHQITNLTFLQCSIDNVLVTASMIATPFEALALLLSSFIKMPGSKKYVNMYMIALPRFSIEKDHSISIHNEGYVQLPKVMLQRQYLSLIITGISLSKKYLQNLVYNYSSTEEGFQFKTGALRIGRQLLVSTLFEDNTLHCYLLSSHGITRFIFNRHNLAFQLKQRGQCRILTEFLQVHSINISYLVEVSNQLRVIIPEMNKKGGQYELLSAAYGNDLQIKVGQNKQIFSQYIRQYFLKEVPLVLTIGTKKLPITPYEKICKGIRFQQEPITSYFQRMHLMLNEESLDNLTSSFVKVYAFNRRVALFCKYPFISGYLQLKKEVPLNAPRTRCENWQVREALQTEIKNILALSRKRPSTVGLSQLIEQAHNA